MTADLPPLYMPYHPLDPSPPTFSNRFRCKFHGHVWGLSHIDFDHYASHLICLRCSRYLVVTNPAISLPLRAVQH